VKLAHMADLHLGFRAFARTTAHGMNQREADVALALRRVVDDLLVQRPDVVVIAGDVFHSVRPTNSAVLHLFQQLQRLRCTLPATRVIIIAGDHDTPRTSAETFILPLYQALGVDVALLEPIVVECEAPMLWRARITAVPRAAVTRIPEPTPGAVINVLVTHGDVPGYGDPHPQWKIDPGVLVEPDWDYIALGHYHVSTQVGPRAWYSGAIEYASTDPWGESRKQAELGLPGKGYLLVDLPGGDPVFRSIEPARPYADLAPIDASGLSAADIDAAIADRLAGVAIDGAVIRLTVREISKDARHHLNFAQLREWRHKALHFQLELQRPDEETSVVARTARMQKLDDTVREFLTGRTLAPDLDRTAFVETGMKYLSEAERTEYP
jgi:DNA repair exonuclease SbcCD nuclease subunit